VLVEFGLGAMDAVALLAAELELAAGFEGDRSAIPLQGDDTAVFNLIV